MIESIIAFVASLLIAYLLMKTRRLSRQNLDIQTALVDTYRNGFMETDQSKEDFIKFISESREWAFEYIETVQKDLIFFVGAVDKDIEYFKKYGDKMSLKANYDALSNISKAYTELKKLLPNDESENK